MKTLFCLFIFIITVGKMSALAEIDEDYEWVVKNVSNHKRVYMDIKAMVESILHNYERQMTDVQKKQAELQRLVKTAFYFCILPFILCFPTFLTFRLIFGKVKHKKGRRCVKETRRHTKQLDVEKGPDNPTNFQQLLKNFVAYTDGQVARNKQELEDVIIEKAKHIMINAMSGGLYKNDSGVKMVCNGLIKYEFFELLRKLLKEVLDTVYERLQVKEIIRSVQNSIVEHEIIAYRVIFDKMKEDDFLNNVEILDLAFNLKNVVENEPSLQESVLGEVQYLMSNLPLSVNNLVFSSKVCIVSRHLQEHLHGSEPVSNEKRGICTKKEGSRTDDKYWVIGKDNDRFYIKNLSGGDYLEASEDFNEEKRIVVLRSERLESSGFDIEVAGDDVYFKTAVTSEYMCSFNDGQDNTNGVFTLKSKTSSHQCLWRIEDCTTRRD